MAQAYLSLRINGRDIEGDSTALEHRGTIECLSFHYEVTADPATERQHKPIRIHKHIDKTTPFLLKALCGNEPVEATFRFYRPRPRGEEELFFTVEIGDGHLSSVKHVGEDAPGADFEPMLEEVGFVFQTIAWAHEASGERAEDSWR